MNISEESRQRVLEELNRKYSVSVVIPTCDRPCEYLDHAVQSVLAQSFQPFEVIIVNNGTNLVENIGHEKIKIVNIKPFSGASAARNAGVVQSSGNYLSFLDDDDWWDKNFLLELVKKIEEKKARFCYGMIVVTKHSSSLEQKAVIPSEWDVTAIATGAVGYGGINFIIERYLFNEIGGFDNSLPGSNDRDLAIRIARSEDRLIRTSKAKAYAREHCRNRIKSNQLNKIPFMVKHWHRIGYLTGFSMISRQLASYLKSRALGKRL